MRRPGALGWQQPDRLPTLDATAVHVWRAPLDQPDELVAALAAHLSPEEEFRVCGYQRPIDRRRFILCRGLLRRLLGAYLSLPPAHVGFMLGPQGKPRLALGGGGLDLRFNVSHSESVALFAVALGREVGVDLEHVRPLVEAETISEQFFSEREKQLLARLPEDEQLEAFFRCWTRKEAYVKARACAAELALPAIDVDFDGDGDPTNVLIGPEAAGWAIAPLTPAPGYIGALAVEGARYALARFHLSVC